MTENELVSAALSLRWLGGVTVKTCDQEVVGSTPGRVAIKWLLLGWMTVCGQVNHLGIQRIPSSSQPSIPPG